MSRLSPRQREIANLTADGLRPDAIAQQLGLKTPYVRRVITMIKKKRGLKSSLEISAHVWKKRMKRLVQKSTNPQLPA